MGRLALTVQRHRRGLLVLAASFVALVVFVLWWFQPQKLFINKTVNEALPAAATVGAPGPTVLAGGRLHSGEHHTEGTVQVLEVGDGQRFVRLSDLRTSNGPVVKVWLTTAAADAGNGEIADAAHVDLGGLKGNIGNQNYAVPASVDVSRFHALVIWCARFHVAFGAAPLTPA